MIRTLTQFLLAALGGMACWGGPAWAVEVTLRTRVVPPSSVVRLGDVAEIASADRELGRRLAAVPLMPVPAPGTQKFLEQREIADMLAASGVDMSEIRFGGPDQVVVTARSGVESTAVGESPSRPVAARQDSRQAILAGNARAADVVRLDEAQKAAVREIVNRIIADYVRVQAGAAAIGRVECNVPERQLSQLALATSAPICSGGRAPWTGRQSFLLSIVTPHGPACVQVAAEIAEPPVAAIVAKRGVARGSVITAADVELRMIERTFKTAGSRVLADHVEKIIGCEARQPLVAGDIVYADQVRQPVLVKKGEMITVGSQGGGIRVSTSARALGDGAQGELIQVEAVGSKERYDVRVVGLRQAAIFTPMRVASGKGRERETLARTGVTGKDRAPTGVPNSQ